MIQMPQERQPILIVDNLPAYFTIQRLKQIFSQFGTVISFSDDGAHTGSIVFEKLEHAENLMKSVIQHPVKYWGKQLNFRWPKARTPFLTIYNLPSLVDQELLMVDLSKFGKVILIDTDRDSYGWVTGGTVEFETIEDAEKVMNLKEDSIVCNCNYLAFGWRDYY